MERHSTMMPSLFSQSSGSRSSNAPSADRPAASTRTLSFISNFSRSAKARGETAGPAPKAAAAAAQKVFATRGGKRHHAFDPKVVPYPMSYDSKIVMLDVLDHVFIMQARKNNVTWVDFKNGTPKRSLDIGCGTGDWVISAAKQWKDCHFVGFDIVPIQPTPAVLQREKISDRVQWVHGNFLTQKLPFEDNSFDHVRVYRVGWGVAEAQWDGLFEQIFRVLRPGGAIEIGEEDILFPTLPPSYTIKLKPRPATPYRPSLTLSPPLSPIDVSTTHAHALLESLFFGVFESRGINCRPTSIIPHYLNIHFRHVITTPNVDLPMPPPPVSRQQLRHMPSDCTARPASKRQSHDSERASSSSDVSLSPSSSSSSLPDQMRQQCTPPTSNSSTSLRSELSADIPAPRVDKLVHAVSGCFEPADPVIDVALLPPAPFDINNRSLAVHLNSAFRRILSCKEAMWDELRRRLDVRNAGGADQLGCFGWDELSDGSDSSDSGHAGAGQDATRELELARARFEEMTTRFERDMLYRTALADAIEANLGWKKPAPEFLSKHERERQKELERAIAAAARAEEEGEEQRQVSRSFKGFIGFKEGQMR